jgi:uncharacterized membrane protein
MLSTINWKIIFEAVLWWRIVYGTLKTILGITLLGFVGTSFYKIFTTLMAHEIIEDPSDILIRTILPYIQSNPAEITYFVALYLIFWGLTEIFLSANLLKERLWAFPTTMIIVGLFVLYEIYRVSYTHSLILFGIIIIDIFILGIIYLEYTKAKVRQLH